MTPKKDAGWKDLTDAGIIPDAGNAVEYETGSWRTAGKPVRDGEKCIDCLLCWIHCPDACIVPDENGKISTTQFLYQYCKGCGICADVCPPKVRAITMVPEEQEVPVT